MKITYYPGCTLKTRARSMDDAARASLMDLGIDLVEPERWTCCGVVHSLAEDDIIRHLGPVRNLIRIKKLGEHRVVVACAMCYNSLARANVIMKQDGDRKQAINRYLEEEEDYQGDLEVVHLLNLIRDEIGWDAIRDRVKAPLDSMRVAAYYGCTLLRPYEVAIESPDHPTILGELLTVLGAKVVDFPAYNQCCSSFQIVSHAEAAYQASAAITESAREYGAEAIVTSCPLCYYNLSKGQCQVTSLVHGSNNRIPVYYFTELMAVAFGIKSVLP